MTRQWIIDFCDRQQGRSARLAGLTSFRFGNRNALERLALAMERFWFNCKLRAIGYSRQRLNALAARLKATAEREIAANNSLSGPEPAAGSGYAEGTGSPGGLRK